jgi:GntR family transcriptional regulator
MPRSASPAYVRIASQLRDRIERGELATGASLPSERELASTLGVSRMTARQALMVLESEGHVHRQTPRGTFVASPRLPMRIGSFSDEVVRSGAQPGDQLLWAEAQPPTRVAAEALGLGEGDLVHALQRLRTADGEAVAIETTYFPADLTPGLLDESLTGSLWSILRAKYGIVARHAEASLEVVTLDAVAAERLAARNAAPGLLVTRRTFDAGGRCFEFARDLYRADRVEFRVEAEIPDPPSVSVGAARRERSRPPRRRPPRSA